MKLSVVKDEIVFAYKHNLPLFLWGAPGIGKSDIVRQAAEELKIDMVDFRAGLMDPTEIKGLPAFNKDMSSCKWVPPDTLPSKGRGLLFLDELNAALPATQASFYQLVQQRRIGDYKLPEGWVPIAAGNRATDRAVVHRMPTALANRFIHLDVHADIMDWRKWAVRHNIHEILIGFLNFKSDLLHKFNPGDNERAFPSPRSWAMANPYITNPAPMEIQRERLAGVVGAGAALELITYAAVFQKLPNIDQLIMSPETAPVMEEPSVNHALTTSLSRRADRKNIDSIMKYMTRLPIEFQTLFMFDVANMYDTADPRSMLTCKSVNHWLVENSSLLT